MIPATCYVDPAGDGKWLVTVMPRDYDAMLVEYTIVSTCEDQAAMEGLRLFEEEYSDVLF